MARTAGAMLLDARRTAKLTQAALERRSGVSRSAISLYERGVREPGADVFLRLLEATGASVSVEPLAEEQVRRGRILSDVLAFASELPHGWPGDRLEFPSGVWRR